jgi:RimJ/RimL family protein N-acetyltransferase
MNVRAVAWADFEGVVELYYSRYEELATNLQLGVLSLREKPSLGEEAEWFARLYRRILERSAVAFVAEEEGRIVGVCTVDRKSDHAEEGHVGVLGVAIAVGYRGKGLGHELLRKTLERCRGRFEIVELSVFTVNAPAIRLYEKLGFRTWGISPRTARRGSLYFDSAHMQLRLDDDRPLPEEPPA